MTEGNTSGTSIWRNVSIVGLDQYPACIKGQLSLEDRPAALYLLNTHNSSLNHPGSDTTAVWASRVRAHRCLYDNKVWSGSQSLHIQTATPFWRWRGTTAVATGRTSDRWWAMRQVMGDERRGMRDETNSIMNLEPRAPKCLEFFSDKVFKANRQVGK
jgi:hypothetical protein